MAVSSLLRPLGIAASLLASLQGLAWSVLALLGIILYTRGWEPLPDEETGITIGLWMYTLFLDTEFSENPIIMESHAMIAFTSIYLALSLIWMIISLCMLWVVYREKWEFGKAVGEKWEFGKATLISWSLCTGLISTLISWSLCTGLISIFDIVTTSLLAADFSSLYSLYNEDAVFPKSYTAVAAAGIVMTIAARGFALLIANIMFAGYFLVCGIQFNQDSKRQEPQREFINGFEQQQPQWAANGNGNVGGFGRAYTNVGFEPDNGQRQNSFDQHRYTATPPQSGTFEPSMRSNLKIPQNPQPLNQPPQNHRPQPRTPYIPEPDYSPTSLRKHPKSVLKSRNHY
ncbi:hypothetical protein QE152_g37498 [Popillia japonica]|uniref:Uncharacterized protein n=1 Tax=Popillia japonica TaxID=7064 RepID=A0AAW1IAA6_POPJA